MENMIKLNYFYGDEPDRLCFYRIPKILFTKEYFAGLSTDAKVLYGLMLDHMSMSRENRWRDDEDSRTADFASRMILSRSSVRYSPFS